MTRALAPLLHAMDEAAGVAPDSRRHALVVDRVLGGLRNDDERRRKFSITYQDFDSEGKAVSRQLEFRLVADHFDPSGGTVLRLSNEAINLYLNALELDIEDAQTAAEAVVQSQLARGKFDEAVQTARNARLQSQRFGEKIDTVLRETRRNLRRVDWREDVPRTIAAALAHIKARLDAERSILAEAERRLDNLEENEIARKVAQIASIMRECHLRHTELHERLMGARNVFLDEQARQSFASAPSLALPALESEVLEPVLRLDRRDATRLLEDGFALFFGARPAALPSLANLVAWQLRPRREQPADAVPIADLDLASSSLEIARFPPSVRAEAERRAASVSVPTRLSALLEQTYSADTAPEVREALVLTVLSWFAPEPDTGAAVKVEKIAGQVLRAAGFFGDDMTVYPRAEANGPRP